MIRPLETELTTSNSVKQNQDYMAKIKVFLCYNTV
jgi:hypothetical protein